MSRYIDADALKEIIMDMRNHAEPSPCLPHQTMLIPDRMVCDKIDAMPTVDAVPVVRCKECIEYRDSVGACHYFNYEPTDEMDFCSHGIRADGERRTE